MEEKTKPQPQKDFIAVIRIRGGRRMSDKTKATLEMLNLRNQHNLILVPNKPSYIGMITKVKDYVTWGEVTPEIKTKIESTSEKKVFRLNPPKGGFERKGIKASFANGGALGYRADKINDLINKMSKW